MGLIDDLRRSYRAGRTYGTGRVSPSPRPQRDDTMVHEQPVAEPLSDFLGFGREASPPDKPGRDLPVFNGDDLAECKAVLAGYVELNANLKSTIKRWSVAIEERDERISALVGERDQACVERNRGQAAVDHARAQIDNLESIIAFPGVKNALRKALHPDTGTNGDLTSRTEIFQTLNAVLARLHLA
jgi:hypothetical protein